MKTKSFLSGILFLLIGGLAFISCGGDSDNDDEKPVPPPTPVKELTFSLEVDNIMAHGADLKVIPSEKDRYYIADVAPASVFENKSEEDIITMIMGTADQSRLIKGDVLFKAEGMSLEPVSEYVLFALGIENNKPTSRLARKNFVTAEEEMPLPELTVSGIVGDGEGNNGYEQLTFKAKSDIATGLIYILADNAKEEEQLKDEGYVERLINEKGNIGTADEIAALNSADGITLTFDNLEAEHEYTFIARVSDKSGAVTRQVTLKTDVKPAPPRGPEITLVGQTGDENGKNKDSYLMFTLSSFTKDVYYAELIVSLKSEIESALSQGVSLEELAAMNKGNGIILTDEAVNMVNTSAYVAVLDNTDGVLPDNEYTCIALAEDFMGTMTVARADVKTEAVNEDNTPPTVETEGFAGDINGNNKNIMVTFKARCTSKNASYAEAFIAESAFVDDILQGMTLEELMTYNTGIGKVLEKTDIDKLNTDGVTITWDEMQGNTDFSVLFCVKTKGGGITVKRCYVKTEPDPVTSAGHNARNKSLGMLTADNIILMPSGKIVDALIYNKVKNDVKNVVKNNKERVGKLPGLFM